MLFIIIWCFFIIIFGLNLIVLASARSSGLSLEVLASFNVTDFTAQTSLRV